VRKGEKVNVDVPVHVEGEAAAETVVTVDAQTLLLAVEATDIPENVTVSVEGLAAGTQIKAADLQLPAGAELLTDPETLVVNVTQQISQEALEAELAEAEEEAGIEHEEAAAPAEGEAAPAEGEGGEAAPAAEGDNA
jgi:large subunit ribosomal protein L25